METFTLLWRSQLAPTPRAKRRIKTRTRNSFGIMAVSRYTSIHNSFLLCLCWKLGTSAIWKAQFALHIWLTYFDFTNRLVLVCSHLPSEEHTQEKISEDCEKEGFDIFIFPSAVPSHFPSTSLASSLMIHLSWLAHFQHGIYISWNRNSGESKN